MIEISRREVFSSARQVIVKAGTRLLIDRNSIAALVDGISSLRAAGKRVLLVTSGAVGRGMEALQLQHRPRNLAGIQALAAVGQSELMAIYSAECRKRGFAVAQLLLTAADLRSRERYLNVMNCVNALWEHGVLPIINENDSVSVDELKFGDNDTLAGLIASLTGSQLTIILTTESGLRTRNADGTLGGRISVVPRLSPEIRALAGGTDDAKFSIGGMSSKLRAAEIVTAAGEFLWIADGREPGVIDRIIRGEDVGTLFLPTGHRMTGYKRWITFFSRVYGRIMVDQGAAKALRTGGKSLLPSGVCGIAGEFKRGDTIEVADPQGRVIARGLVNFNSMECSRICGKHSAEVHAILGTDADEEIIHRDHLTLVEDSQ